MWDGIYADSLIQLRHIFIQYRFFIETTLSFCRVLPSQSSLTDRKVFCKAMLCFLWSTWVVRKCCFLLQTHRRQSIMDFPQPRYRNAKKRVQIQMLCIYKDCNSTEDKVWSRYRNTNASTNTNTVYLQTLQQQRRQGVLDFPQSRSLYRRRQIELLGKTAWVISVVQKIKRLSESPAPVLIIAELYKIDSKNKKLTRNKFNKLPRTLGIVIRRVDWAKIRFGHNF